MLTPVPPSNCARARESASARLDGELAELQAAQLEAHLRSCPECRAYVAGIEVITRDLRAAALEQPAVAAFVPQRHRRRSLIPAAAAAAIVVAVAGSSFAIGGMFGRQASHVPPATSTASAALAGPIDQLVLSAVRSQKPAPFRVSSRIIAV
ncbi:MAG: putative zinc-finger [Gaiellaceae bacterium]|jgi:predicted anti-sigma-YlaC factor YlaD|nr:putative zinc-finger [Gaiellaceae bacterium]